MKVRRSARWARRTVLEASRRLRPSTHSDRKEYLSRHFDHGAAMVNILGFYEGAEISALGKKDGPRGESALAAFHAFRSERVLEPPFRSWGRDGEHSWIL